jgi:parallel beta-helix repeat protein
MVCCNRPSRRPVLPFGLLLGILALSPLAHAATYHVSAQGDDAAAGTPAAPWRTLQHAVDSLKPGDTALVGPGVYRERIEMRNSGTALAPITLSAMPGARVVVSGADLLPDGWTPVPGLAGAYSHDWTLRFPINGPNDLTHPGDPAHAWTGRAEQVFHNGRLLRQVLRREQLAHGTFFVDLEAGKLLVWLRDSRDPAETEVEASARSQWLAADASYVHLRGITFRGAANHAQRGAFLLHGDGWVVADCVFERANGPGASLTGSGHRLQRCVFQDNGQLGFGAWSCHDTRMEECAVYRNNAKGYSTEWEAGGLKVTMSRGFAMLGCRVVDNRGPGIWYDIGNEQAEVGHCYVADNDEAGLFYEISYSLHAHDNLVVNNANCGVKPGRAWGNGGITLSSSEDCLVEHNTLVGNRDGITFREQNRSTPRIGGGEQRIMNRNHVIRNNVIAFSPAYNVAFWLDTTFFGPHPGGHDRNDPIFEDPRTLNFRFENNFLAALPGQANYLFGCPWRPKSKTAQTPAEFSALAGIADSSQVGDPGFADVLAHDFRLLPDSPAGKLGVGVRDAARIPQR